MNIEEVFLNGRMLDSDALKQTSTLSLAYVGDAVFELLVRTSLNAEGMKTHGGMHGKAIRCVNAAAQARAIRLIEGEFTEEEAAVAKRGRNAAPHSKPKNMDTASYSSATSLETVFGWLWMSGRQNRAVSLFAKLWTRREEWAGGAEVK